jgi:hypothetical protein
MSGKGDTYRRVNQEAYDRSWQRIFGDKRKDRDEKVTELEAGQEEE